MFVHISVRVQRMDSTEPFCFNTSVTAVSALSGDIKIFSEFTQTDFHHMHLSNDERTLHDVLVPLKTSKSCLSAGDRNYTPP